MTKILILTSKYLNDDNELETPVVHYFAKKWVEKGVKLSVINFRSNFPRIFYKLFYIFPRATKMLFQTDLIYKERLNNVSTKIIDNVLVIKKPIYKHFPYFRYPSREIISNFNFIKDVINSDSDGFTHIAAHFYNPQLPLLYELRKEFKDVTMSIVLHEDIEIIYKRFKNKLLLYLEAIDFVGFRDNHMKEKYIKKFGFRNGLFVCPSGIPEHFIVNNTPNNKFISQNIKICFIGMLIPLKNIEIIIDALIKAFPQKNYVFTIVGEGMLMAKFKNIIKKFNLEKNIVLTGKLSRIKAQDILDENDIFVMLSKPESFGLVYLEAMSKGCITICSKGQSFDGIILNGVNGFVSSPNDVNELAVKLKYIHEMSYEKKIEISNNAINTAKRYTDDIVAKSYLDTICVSPR